MPQLFDLSSNNSMNRNNNNDHISMYFYRCLFSITWPSPIQQTSPSAPRGEASSLTGRKRPTTCSPSPASSCCLWPSWSSATPGSSSRSPSRWQKRTVSIQKRWVFSCPGIIWTPNTDEMWPLSIHLSDRTGPAPTRWPAATFNSWHQHSDGFWYYHTSLLGCVVAIMVFSFSFTSTGCGVSSLQCLLVKSKNTPFIFLFFLFWCQICSLSS